MDSFLGFQRLPPHIRKNIWKHCIITNPCIHFLSFPGDHSPSLRWKVESRRYYEVPDRPHVQRIRVKHSAYWGNLALMHACRESRQVYFNHVSDAASKQGAANTTALLGSDHKMAPAIATNLDEDIVCFQDVPDGDWAPWTLSRFRGTLPQLAPKADGCGV